MDNLENRNNRFYINIFLRIFGANKKLYIKVTLSQITKYFQKSLNHQELIQLKVIPRVFLRTVNLPKCSLLLAFLPLRL